MSTRKKLEDNIYNIVEIARFAPSAHNTQPYKIKIAFDKIIINIDKKFKLIDGDPTGRQTIIGLGIFTEAIIQSAEGFGLAKKRVLFQNNESCLIEFKTLNKNKVTSVESLLKSRTTDRSVYNNSKKIKPGIISELERIPTSPGVKLHISTDEKLIKRVAKLTSMGMGIALSSPAFRKELSGYLVQPLSNKNRGISVKSLYIPLILAVIEPWTLRFGIRLGFEKRAEYRRWCSATGLALITSSGDMSEDWFKVGRDYFNLSLRIEELGLSQATSASTVEASTFHEDVESLIHTKQRLQAVVRIGYGAKKRSHSPRVSASELITT